MNTAIEVKLDSDPNGSPTDRRRGMALVGLPKLPERKRSFTISVSSDVFSAPSRTATPTESKAIPESITRAARRVDTVAPVSSDSSRKLVTAAAWVAFAGASVIGYLVGRQRK